MSEMDRGESIEKLAGNSSVDETGMSLAMMLDVIGGGLLG